MSRSSALPLPLLAMVDAFVSSVAIILVMVIISTPQSEATGQTPRTDIVVGCNAETITVEQSGDETAGPPRPVASAALVATLTAATAPGALAQGVRIEADSADFFCALEIEKVLAAANDELDVDSGSPARPVFVTYSVFREVADAP